MKIRKIRKLTSERGNVKTTAMLFMLAAAVIIFALLMAFKDEIVESVMKHIMSDPDFRMIIN